MSGNPRKFSEKIAIHQRKLNEEQNAFESIMAEMSGITRTPDPMSSYTGHQWGGPGTSAGGGGFYMGGGSGDFGSPISGHHHQQQQRMSQQSSTTHHHQHSRGRSPGAGGGNGSGSGGGGHHSQLFHPYRNMSPHQQQQQQHAAAGPALPTRQQSPERPQMTPPYPGAPMYHLVPPQDTSWRRTHSDPGIHASVMQPTIPGVIPMNQRTAPNQNNVSPVGSPIGDKSQSPSGYFLEPKVTAPQYRPRSCDNVPNISIHPSEPVAGPQIPISSNTGSLPDLPSSLPGHIPLQQLEGMISGQAQPTYAQSMVGGGGGYVGVPPSLGPHQQRHSIQLPVQYPPQGIFGSVDAGSGGSSSSNYVAYGTGGQHSLSSQAYSPFYQPDSPRSGPSSPNEPGGGGGGGAGSGDSPASSPQAQVQSPGSPYYSLHTQLQNINIDSQEPLSPSSSQHNAYFGMGSPSYNVGSMGSPSNAYQQYSAAVSQPQRMPMSQEQYRQQMYQALFLRQQSPGDQFHTSTSLAAQQSGLQMHQTLASPTSGQIPDIIFTGADGSISVSGTMPNMNAMGGAGGYMDPTVEMLSSDLRISLDPVDLESLHGLGSEQGLRIDAESENELRRDRV